MLAAIAATVSAPGKGRVKPSVYLSPTAHAISNNPAITSSNQSMSFPSEARSLRRYAGILNYLGEMRVLGLELCGDVLRRGAALQFHALLGKAGAYVRRLHEAHYLAMKACQDILRRSGRRHHAVEDARLV